MKYRTAGCVAAVLLGSLIGAAPGADAAPAPACVSKHEFNSSLSGVVRTRPQLENHWGVRGQGHRVRPSDPMPEYYRNNVRPGSLVIKYRVCGYPLHKGAAYVYYDRRHKHPMYFASLWTGQVPMVPAGTYPNLT